MVIEDRHHVGAPAFGSRTRPKPPFADDGADVDVDVDARNVLSNVTILPLPHRMIWMQISAFPVGFELNPEPGHSP